MFQILKVVSVLLLVCATEAFQVGRPIQPAQNGSCSSDGPLRNPMVLHDVGSPLETNMDDGEEMEPGKMRVSEIKAELDLRGVSYDDCFDKESLSLRLKEARATGRANPDILDKFNKAKLEQTFNEERLEIRDEDLDKVIANDGTLPGGLEPETFKKLIENPEVMAMLQSPKMQEAMQLMMTGGQTELENKMKEDPELIEIVKKLNEVLNSI